MTDAPGARPPRSAALTLTQSVLALEGFAALFATSLLNGFQRSGDLPLSQGAIWGAGLGVTALLLLAAGLQGRPGGRAIGWILQVPMIAGGALSLSVALVGGMFVVLWIGAIRLGGRIDRERGEYLAAARERTGGDR